MKEKKAKKIMEDVKKTYNTIAEDFSNTRNRTEHEFKMFVKYIHPDKKILDLGCGNGRFLVFLKELIKEKDLAQNYIGVDNSKELLKIAREKHPGINFILGDQLQIPLKNDTCDLIFNIRAFHHIPSKKLRVDALKEMKRVLKNDGIMVISVWNLWQMKYAKELASAFARWILTAGNYACNDTLIKWGKKRKRYYHAFTRQEFIKTVKSAGMKIHDFNKVGHDYVITAGK